MLISDAIAKLIEEMINEGEGAAEIKRNDLAGQLGCVPSQINYVITSRFTPERGYIIESRRGGGGYIRIFRMQQDSREQILYMLNERIGDSIDALSASHLISQLQEREFISPKEAALMNAAISSQALSLPLSAEMKNALRAKILKSMLLDVARHLK